MKMDRPALEITEEMITAAASELMGISYECTTYREAAERILEAGLSCLSLAPTNDRRAPLSGFPREVER